MILLFFCEIIFLFLLNFFQFSCPTKKKKTLYFTSCVFAWEQRICEKMPKVTDLCWKENNNQKNRSCVCETEPILSASLHWYDALDAVIYIPFSAHFLFTSFIFDCFCLSLSPSLSVGRKERAKFQYQCEHKKIIRIKWVFFWHFSISWHQMVRRYNSTNIIKKNWNHCVYYSVLWHLHFCPKLTMIYWCRRVSAFWSVILIFCCNFNSKKKMPFNTTVNNKRW